MMGEEHGKDEISAQNMLKNHDALEQTVNDYADTIRTLGESARGLINEGHAEGFYERMTIFNMGLHILT